MNLGRKLWRDETGSVLSAEAVLLGAVLAAGATAGLKMAGDALNSELTEAACAVRSLDQSYSFTGYQGCHAATAGSCYIQPPVDEALRELRGLQQEELPVEQKKEGAPTVKPQKKRLKPKSQKEEQKNPVHFEL